MVFTRLCDVRYRACAMPRPALVVSHYVTTAKSINPPMCHSTFIEDSQHCLELSGLLAHHARYNRDCIHTACHLLLSPTHSLAGACSANTIGVQML